MINKDTTSASEFSDSDSDEDGRDDGAKKVSHLIRMHQLS